MTTKQTSSIIDLPRKHDQPDLFEINKYQKGLSTFIRNADTPLTIALQGEWGSGKTSLMNVLKQELCDQQDSPYYSIWINTWQYSLMKTPTNAILKIIEGAIEQLQFYYKVNAGKKTEIVNGVKKAFFKISKIAVTSVAKTAVGTIGGDADVIDDLFSNDEPEGAEIEQLKHELQKLINEVLIVANEKGNKKMGSFFSLTI